MTPRILPLADHEMDDRQRELVQPYVQDGHTENVFRTMAQYPGMLKRWGPMIGHVLVKNSPLPARPRNPHPAHRLSVPRGV